MSRKKYSKAFKLMLVEQICTDIADVIESEGVFYE